MLEILYMFYNTVIFFIAYQFAFPDKKLQFFVLTTVLVLGNCVYTYLRVEKRNKEFEPKKKKNVEFEEIQPMSFQKATRDIDFIVVEYARVNKKHISEACNEIADYLKGCADELKDKDCYWMHEDYRKAFFDDKE